MARNWHILRKQDQVTLARHLPPRFDLSASTTLASGDALRLATQIRQDVWRALQKLRGFSPVVEVTQSTGGVQVTAGGRVFGAVPEPVQDRLQAVLDNPKNRARWVRCAGGMQ
ncbi:hypothetical protein ASD8599_02851 [Ascidiaceihabitans donghaensis]|uniref:Uncharacterized protein n=1 Tax=Ascidiaceihabitans donghaensis TaxID=1510460 RepID=A0A2R8BG71_9RHOB|nr:hypothetical protein [Ascidiaceihabitans donghaensis]SPH22106.1 hypothetical protein ASD8599_02851 [Ascidiaceihabitans donghaensis]